MSLHNGTSPWLLQLVSNSSTVDSANSTGASLSPLGELCAPYFSRALLESPFIRWSLPLQPYWLTVLFSFSMFLLPLFWNGILVPLVSLCVGRLMVCCGKPARPRSNSLPTTTLFTPTAGLMAAQLAVQIVHLVFIASSLTAGQNAWRNYSELFGRWLNSGYLAIPLSMSRVFAMLDLLEHNGEDTEGYLHAFLGTSAVDHGKHTNRLMLKLAPPLCCPCWRRSSRTFCLPSSSFPGCRFCCFWPAVC